MNDKILVIADIHGDFAKLIRMYNNFRKEGFKLRNTRNMIIQLGDRVDRGKDSYRVNNFFIKLKKRFPSQVVLLHGNHEDMMLEAAQFNEHEHSFYYNGGQQTLASYSRVSKYYGKNNLYRSVKAVGHNDTLFCPKFYETSKYFFSHAPIPKPQLRKCGDLFREDKDALIWSYFNTGTENWVDPNVVDDKISIHGHIHGMRRLIDGSFISAGVRRHGNAILLDTGCGCSYYGRLTGLLLPDMITIDDEGTKGEI